MWAKSKKSHQKRGSLVLFVITVLALLIGQLSPLVPSPRVYADENNDKLSIDDQHARTELYALIACLNQQYASPAANSASFSSTEVSSHQIWPSANWGVSVGYEISPQGDNGTDPGTIKCADLDYGAALGFAKDSKFSSYDDLAKYLFKQNSSGDWGLKKFGQASALAKILQTDANKRKQSNYVTVFGPQERKRRTLVALAQCVTAASDPHFSDVQINGQPYNWRGGVSPTTEIQVGNDWEPDGQLQCQTLVNIINKDYPNALQSLPNGVTLDSLYSNPQALAQAGGAAGGNATANQTNGSSSSTDTCDAGDFSLNWILCPIYNGVSDLTDWMLKNVIGPLLNTEPVCLDASGANCDNTVYRVWSTFRVYGDIFLIIALLVVVFGESLGGGLIDAYTAKKILPRLLAAAILINLSIYIAAFLVDLTNIIGGGVGQLVTAPLQGNGAFTITPSGIQQNTIVFGTAAGLIAGGFTLGLTGIVLLLVGLAITGMIAILGVFVTLIIRQAVILALIMIAPVAFALWCLPNTANWFKRWWDTLFQMLLVYPIIVLIFAVADIMSYLTEHNGQGGPLAAIISFMLLIIPLYLIPFTLRSSNRILGAVQGAVGNIGKQINAATGRRALAGAGAEVGKNLQLMREGNRLRGGTYHEGEPSNFRGRVNRLFQNTALSTPANIGMNPRRMRDRLRAARSTQISTTAAEKAEKSAAARVIAGNDDLLAASLHGAGTEADARGYLSRLGQRGDELEQNVASIRQAKRDMGDINFQDFAAANLAGTGTGYRGGPSEMFETINRVAGNDRARATRILASARGQAERAKRIDLAGSGFATAADLLGQMHTDNITAEAVNERMGDEVLTVKSAGEIGTARNNALTNLTGAVQRRLARAQAAVQNAAEGTAERAQAEHEYKRVVAHTASLLDVAGSASPENAQVVGAIMGQHMGGEVPERYEQQQAVDLTGNPAVDQNTNMPIMRAVGVGSRPETLHDVIEAMRSDPEFQQYRREYGSARSAAAAEAGGLPPDFGAPPEEQ